MEFQSINPYNGKIIQTYSEISENELISKLEMGDKAFSNWRKSSFPERSLLMKNVARDLENNCHEYAKIITLEMGKPIIEARAEVKKCAWVCQYYAEKAEGFLQNEIINSDAQKSFVTNNPIGGVLAIMPWNFPFWQVFRFAAPTLMAGNIAFLKHALNVFGCAALIESIFKKAGFPEGAFQNLIIHHNKIEQIIAHPAIKAITLTGSETAGSSVAEIAGKYIKKGLLELGGNNAFIVWKDADLDKAVEVAVVARMLNCGQSCIAAKRFILVEEIYDEFVFKYTNEIKKLKSGDPMDEATVVGPLARKDIANQLQKQITESISLGAELILGGKQDECFHEPTILGNVTQNMPTFREETFGPLAAMIKAKDEKHAFELANDSKFGLGISVFTKNIEKALAMSDEVEDGAYFINEMVKSDPRLPFGGTKHSGYGRELSKDGILEFVNRKTVYLK